MLQIDLSDNPNNMGFDVVRRSGKLYDKISHSYTWAKDREKVECDIVWLFDWVDLPRPIQDHITSRAASIVSSRIVGDPNQYQILQQKEAFTRAMAMEYECNQGDYTFFGHPEGTNNYQSYKPFKALYR
jgi:hypothetical protein